VPGTTSLCQPLPSFCARLYLVPFCAGIFEKKVQQESQIHTEQAITSAWYASLTTLNRDIQRHTTWLTEFHEVPYPHNHTAQTLLQYQWAECVPCAESNIHCMSNDGWHNSSYVFAICQVKPWEDSSHVWSWFC
jgi:hypothetical protein